MPIIHFACAVVAGLLVAGCTMWQTYPEGVAAPQFTAAGDEPGHPLPGRLGLQAGQLAGLPDGGPAAPLAMLSDDPLPTMPPLHPVRLDHADPGPEPAARPGRAGPATRAAPRTAVARAALPDAPGPDATSDDATADDSGPDPAGDAAAGEPGAGGGAPVSAHAILALQLAPYRQIDDARQGWTALTSRVPELGQLQPMLRAMVLGDAGMFHRLFAVGLDADGFRQLCARIHDRMPTCTVVSLPLD